MMYRSTKRNPLFNSSTLKADPVGRRAFLTGASAIAGVGALAMRRPFQTFAANRTQVASGPVTVMQFSDAGKPLGKSTVPKVIRSDEAWRQKLTPISYEVTREEGTERPYSGSTWNNHDHGFYRCICCDNALFSSGTKFESGTGWPSFWQPIAKENILEADDQSLGMDRTAVSCRECDAHLGHVFDDGPRPTGLRYCMNSAAMRFVKTA